MTHKSNIMPATSPLFCNCTVEQSSIAHHCCPLSLSIFCCHLKSHLFSLSYATFWLFSYLYRTCAQDHIFMFCVFCVCLTSLWALLSDINVAGSVGGYVSCWLVCYCQDTQYRPLQSQLSKEVLQLPAQLHNSTASIFWLQCNYNLSNRSHMLPTATFQLHLNGLLSSL